MYALFFSEETHEINCNQVGQDEGNEQGLLLLPDRFCDKADIMDAVTDST